MTGLLLLAAAGLLVLAAGGFPRRTAAAAVVGRTAGALVAGAVLVHLLLQVLSAGGVRWSAASVTLPTLALALAWLRSPLDRAAIRLARPGWGLLVGAVPVALFGFLSAVRLAHSPDFVYHWGLKAQRFLAMGGLDPSLLERPGAWRIHPDYPQLVPELMALPGLLAGRFDERAALLLAAAIAAATVLAFRFVLRAHGVAGFGLEAGTALCGAAVGGFGFIHGMAGGADGFVALALLVGVAALVSPDRGSAPVALGWAAAFAAAAKIEGIALALLLVAAGFVVWRPGARRPAGRRAGVALAAPTLIVVSAWWLEARGRFLATNAGPPRWAELGTVLRGVAEAAVRPDSGLYPLLLLALPLALRSARLRAGAAVVLGQLGLYLALYLISPVDLDLLLATSAARLLSHLVPATLLLLLLLLLHAAEPPRQPALPAP